MAHAPKVSIIVAAYAADATIGAAIASCLAQTVPDFEVIIVDDASPTSLETAVSRAADGDERVRFERLASNGGPSAARNKALDLAGGEFVMVLDADDTMRPDRLEVMLAAARSANADIVVDNMIARRIDGDGKVVEAPFLDLSRIGPGRTITLPDYMDPSTSELFGQPLGYLKPLIRRAFVEANALRYDCSLTNSEDYYFIAELLACGADMHLIAYSGYVYTIQAGSTSHRLSPQQAAAIVTAESQFQARHADLMDTAVRRAGQARLRHWQRVCEFETLVEDLRRRSILSFVVRLMRNPRTAPRHIGQFTGIAWKKLRGVPA